MNTELIEYFDETKVDNQSETIPIEPVCDAFRIQFKHQVLTINDHPSLKKEVQLIANKTIFGDDRKRFHLTKKGFTMWLLGLDYKIVKPEIRDTFVNYQYGILDYLYESTEAREQILKKKAELKTRADELAIKLLNENPDYKELVEIKAAIARTGTDINKLDGKYYNKQLELFANQD
jgi:hypothetical protein